jgi:hypothetical protein
MTKLNSILNIVLYAILAVTLFLAGLFYFGGYVEGAAYPTPNFTDPILNWGIVLVIATSAFAIISEIAFIVLRPKNAVRSLISIGALAVMVLGAYSLGDDTPLVLAGYTGPDNVPSMLVMSDTMLYTMYFLFAVAIGSIAYSEISRLFR